MCTVSVIKVPGFLRLVSNRDEQRSRPAALPPTVTQASDLRVLAPTDPASQGTWIACNEAGLAIALLNVNPPSADPRIPPRSRGEIVPGLIRSHSLDEVAELAAAIDHREFAPFRVVAVHANEAEVLELSPGTGLDRRVPTNEPADVHVVRTRRPPGRRPAAAVVRANGGSGREWRAPRSTGPISRASLARQAGRERSHVSQGRVDGQPNGHRDWRGTHRDVLRV